MKRGRWHCLQRNKWQFLYLSTWHNDTAMPRTSRYTPIFPPPTAFHIHTRTYYLVCVGVWRGRRTDMSCSSGEPRCRLVPSLRRPKKISQYSAVRASLLPFIFQEHNFETRLRSIALTIRRGFSKHIHICDIEFPE